jgi:hypothetical protein
MAAALSNLFNIEDYLSRRDNPQIEELIRSGAITLGQGGMTGGGENSNYSPGAPSYNIDWAKMPAIAGTNYRPGDDTGSGIWRPVMDDQGIDPSRVIDDPNYGKITTSDNAQDLSGGWLDYAWMIPLLAAGAGAAGLFGAGEGALGANIAQGMGGSALPAGSGVSLGGAEMLTGLQDAAFAGGVGGAAGGAAGASVGGPDPLSAADAYEIASGGQASTPFKPITGGLSMADIGKVAQQAGGLLGGGGAPGEVGGGGGGGGLLGGGGGAAGGGGDYFMALLRKYYGTA